MTPADLLTWPLDLVATACTICLGLHFREESRTALYSQYTAWVEPVSPEYARMLVWVDVFAVGLVGVIIGGVWLP